MEVKKTVLLTGITGFIGRHTARKIVKNYAVTAIVRPDTDKRRYAEFESDIKIAFVNLSNISELSAFLEKNSFDVILHIGAMRSGRNFSKAEYFKANVQATELLMNNAIQHNSRFIYCSSVGVFGTIPVELPANNRTPYNPDNLYHSTKVQCEKLIDKAILDRKLKAYIVRPSITYGVGDYGFPYTLTKLIAKKLLFIPKNRLYLHLTNVDALAEVFSHLLEADFPAGKTWNVADSEKVCYQDLIDFIYKRIQENSLTAPPVKAGNTHSAPPVKAGGGRGGVSLKPYPTSRYLKKKYFETFTKIAKFFKREVWITRFELISNSWFFDTAETYEDFNLKNYRTIPDFKTVVDWYCVNKK